MRSLEHKKFFIFFWYDVCLYVCTVHLLYELGYIIPCVDKLMEQKSHEYDKNASMAMQK
jgi:hypothetical protein